jgi:hypothetical protein
MPAISDGRILIIATYSIEETALIRLRDELSAQGAKEDVLGQRPAKIRVGSKRSRVNP